jgi:hypothetical protein
MCALVNGPPEVSRLQSAHNCGQGHTGCVHPQHLRWDTCGGNHADKALHGTEIKGEDQWQARLTEADVHYIRSQRGIAKQSDLAARFGINQTSISKVQRRVAWAWLE